MKDTVVTFNSILKKLNFNDEESAKIKEAYLFACEEHKGLKRHTGDDYISHPLHVADILCDLNVDEKYNRL